MTFGEKLKSIRTQRKMTQEEFAKLLGTSKQVISRYETNKRTPKITVAKKYAEILNISFDYLINDNLDSTITDREKNVDSDLIITDHQKKVIDAYINQPEMQPAVDKLLGIRNDCEISKEIAEDMIKKVERTDKICPFIQK